MRVVVDLMWRSPPRPQLLQRFAIQPVNRPFIHGPCSQPAIEIDGRLVPVQDRPLHSAATPLHRDRGQMLQQPFSNAMPPVRRPHEDVLQVQGRRALEGGKGMEEEGESGRNTGKLRHQHLGAGGGAEEVGRKRLGVCPAFVAQLLVHGQLLDEGDNERCISGFCRPDVDLISGYCVLHGLNRIVLAVVIHYSYILTHEGNDSMQDVLRKIQDEKDAHVEKLVEWLRIPSISTDSNHNADTRRAGQFILDELLAAGFTGKLNDTPGHPVVTAEWTGAPGAGTLLVYGHYDVQPTDPDSLWNHPPFDPVIESGDIFARGATDDKGQALAVIRGISATLQVKGKLPLNVKFLIEGEEEIGSPNLEPFILEHRDWLDVDTVLIADCAMFGSGIPAITVGLKGLVYLEVTLTGANTDLHSGSFGGGVENPGHVLCAMLSSLKDGRGRITIPGFYDDVIDLTPEERAAFKSLPFDENEYSRNLGVPRVHGEAGYTTLERTGARPTLDINGLCCGWTGEGAKTVLPAKATGKFSMRLVADQNPDRINTLVTEHLKSICPDTVTLEVASLHGAEPVLVPADSPYLQAASRAMARGFGKTPVFTREGGSIPVVATFKKILGADSILMGLGLNSDNAHAPNEKFSLDSFQKGIVTTAHMLDELAGI